MSSRTAPSPKTIVTTDFLSLVGALFPPIGVAVAVAGQMGVLPDKHRSIVEGQLVMSKPVGPSVFLFMAAAFVIAGLALLAWRFARIRAAFASGHRIPGTLTKLAPFKDRAYVHYEYTVHGQPIGTRHLVHQTERYKRLGEGQAVTIAVDPARPAAGFVVELFEGG
jgi:Flp pilus assembly protein CpaB